MNLSPNQKFLASLAFFVSLAFFSSLSACKDKEPCDEGWEAIGTACYEKHTPVAAAGAPDTGEGGSGATGGSEAVGGAAEPVGNPDATFLTPCETDADCGNDAPICLIPPGPKYCSQIDCKPGEANDGKCPENWICFQLNPQTHSACLK